MNSPLHDLKAAGVSIWLDDLSRDRIESGSLSSLIETRAVSGVTTNPTIFAGAFSKGAAYAAQLAELASRGASADEASLKPPLMMFGRHAMYSRMFTLKPRVLMVGYLLKLSPVSRWTAPKLSSKQRLSMPR